VPLRRIMVIRHGEKPSLDGSVLGVDVAGSPNPDELSVRGWQRAGALVRFFAPADGPQRPGIQSPEFLFATGLSQHVTSVRAAHTLAPLADFLGKPVSTRFAKGEEEQLAAAIGALSGVVLVALEHKGICPLANFLLGSNNRTPQLWPDDRFDLVWVFESDEEGWHFSQVPQLLLAGDSAEPIS